MVRTHNTSIPWVNADQRTRNIGVAEVSATAPLTPPPGLIWLDTDAASNGVLDVATLSSNTTLSASHLVVLVNAASGPITITLPVAASHTGRRYYIKKIDSSGNAVTIDGNGSETIDGGLTIIIGSQYNSITIVCDGSNWHIL